MRRRVPILIALVLTSLLGWYVVYTQRVVAELRSEARRTGQMFARVYSALADPREDVANDALLDLSRHITQMKVPVIVTDEDGRPTARANLPFEARLDDPRVREYVAVLDRLNAPVVEPGVGTVHFGHTPLVSGLRVIPIAQVVTVLLLVAAGTWTLRVRANAERERVWAGMARESAHQLGTPLSSLSGWIELLRERGEGDPTMVSVTDHMQADYERLERVAHRFERIGRPPRREPVDIGLIVERIGTYFRARVPTRANAVHVACARPEEPVVVQADPVLLEWALESLVRNAVDALAGRGGRIYLATSRLPDGRVRIRVADDGPGIPRDLRTRIFDAGFTTKTSGWGIGLPLAQRIVEEWHGGRLVLVPVERGATFDVILEA
jgi:signal transduction histidine kinase